VPYLAADNDGARRRRAGRDEHTNTTNTTTTTTTTTTTFYYINPLLTSLSVRLCTRDAHSRPSTPPPAKEPSFVRSFVVVIVVVGVYVCDTTSARVKDDDPP
jgi:hypothetical protein